MRQRQRDQRREPGDVGRLLGLGLAHHRADAQMAVVAHDALELVETVDVDQQRRRAQAHGEGGDEALAAGEQARIGVLAHQRDGVLHRASLRIGERRGLQGSPPVFFDCGRLARRVNGRRERAAAECVIRDCFFRSFRGAAAGARSAAERRRTRNPYVDGPLLARGSAACDRSVCDHMSGMVMRPHMTAAKMGYTARVPNSGAASSRPLDSTECLASWIAGSHHLSFSSKLRHSANGAVRRRAELGWRVRSW